MNFLFLYNCNPTSFFSLQRLRPVFHEYQSCSQFLRVNPVLGSLTYFQGKLRSLSLITKEIEEIVLLFWKDFWRTALLTFTLKYLKLSRDLGAPWLLGTLKMSTSGSQSMLQAIQPNSAGITQQKRDCISWRAQILFLPQLSSIKLILSAFIPCF